MTLEQHVGPVRPSSDSLAGLTVTGLPWRGQAGLARRRPARLGDLARGRDPLSVTFSDWPRLAVLSRRQTRQTKSDGGTVAATPRHGRRARRPP